MKTREELSKELWDKLPLTVSMEDCEVIADFILSNPAEQTTPIEPIDNPDKLETGNPVTKEQPVTESVFPDDFMIPRRNRLDLNTPAELAIYNAMQEVEKMGADVRLTEAQFLLGKARNLVADFVDSKKEV